MKEGVSMNKMHRTVAFTIAVALLSTLAPCASAFAEESATSGDFNDIFHWEYADETLTFSVKPDAEIDGEVTLSFSNDSSDDSDDSSDGILYSDILALPWTEYYAVTKNIVLDDRISYVSSAVFCGISAKKNSTVTSITCGEACTWTHPVGKPYGGFLTFRAPEYSPTYYFAMQNGYDFESTGMAENPVFVFDSETWQFQTKESLIKLSNINNSNLDELSSAKVWCHMYERILLGEDTVYTDDFPSYFYGYVVCGLGENPNPNIAVYCYPNLSCIDKLRELGTPVVVLGEDSPERKGDANLDGAVGLDDASEVLSYYAQTAAGLDASFTQDEDLNLFAYYLADVDTESTAGVDTDTAQVDLEDASHILSYYAQTAAGLSPDWETILSS
jgi:hypothetical protein